MVTSILKTDGLTPPYWLRGKSPTLTRLLLLLVLMLSLPLTAGARDVYLFHSGYYTGSTQDAGAYWENSSKTSDKKFTENGDTYTLTLDNPQGDHFYFRIGINNWTQWIFAPSTDGQEADITNASTATISSNISQLEESNKLSWNVKYNQGAYSKITITFNLNNSNPTQSTIVVTGTSSSGGDTPTPTPTTTNQPGLYIFGSNYDNISGTPTSDTKLHYKLLKSGDNTYYIGVNASDYLSDANHYAVNTYKKDGNSNISQVTNNTTFRLAYVDADGNMTFYGPQNGYSLKGIGDIPETTARQTKQLDNNSSWTINNNNGFYKIFIDVDENGAPKDWYFHSAPDSLIAYRASSTSDWTTDAYLVSPLMIKTDGSADQRFFGMVNFTADEEYKWIFMDKWFGERTNPVYGYYEANVAMDGDESAPNFKFAKHTQDTFVLQPGVYSTEFNPTNHYMFSGDNLPTRIFIYGPAVTGDESVKFTDWDYTKADELNWDDEEQCYKGVINFTQNKTFRFLRNTNIEGQPTSNALSFPEDENVVTNATDAVNGDRWDNNHVSYQSTASDDPTNIIFVATPADYTVRFYIDRLNGTSFNWSNNARFRYTMNVTPSISISPRNKSVEGATSIEPKVTVSAGATTRYFVYTLDGSEPKLGGTDDVPVNGSSAVQSYDSSTADSKSLGLVNTTPDGHLTVNGVTIKDFSDEDDYVTLKIHARAVTNTGTADAPVYALEGEEDYVEYKFFPKTYNLTVEPGNYTKNIGSADAPDYLGVNAVNIKVSVELVTEAPQSQQEEKGPAKKRKFYIGTPTSNKTSLLAGKTVLYKVKNADGSWGPTMMVLPENITTSESDNVGYIRLYEKQNPSSTESEELKVWIEGREDFSESSKDVKYDITYSTSEAGYEDPMKTSAYTSNYYYSPRKDFRVFVKYTGKETTTPDLYVYAQLAAVDGTYYLYPLTTADGVKLEKKEDVKSISSDGGTIKDLGEWYVLQLKGYLPAINNAPGLFNIAVYDQAHKDKKYLFGQNAHNDMFIEYDGTTATDVTPTYTGQTSYNIYYDEDGNPVSDDGYSSPTQEVSPTGDDDKFAIINLDSYWTADNAFQIFSGRFIKRTDGVKIYNGENATGDPVANICYGGSDDTEESEDSEGYNLSIESPAEGTTSDTDNRNADFAKAKQLPFHAMYKIPMTLSDGDKFTVKGFADADPAITYTFRNGGVYAYDGTSDVSAEPVQVYAQHSEENAQSPDFKPNTISSTDDTDCNLLPYALGDRSSKIDVSGFSTSGYDEFDNFYYTSNGNSDWIKTFDGYDASKTKSGEGMYTGAPNVLKLNNKTADNPLKIPVNGNYKPSTNITVQMLVRPVETPSADVKATLSVSCGNNSKEASVTFGSKTKGNVTADGRIDEYSEESANGDWRKLEVTVKGDGASVPAISVSGDADFYISNVTLLEDANTPGHFYTHAETDKDASSLDLSDRSKVNAFSFFDRGDNKNAIVFVSNRTVLGGAKDDMIIPNDDGQNDKNNQLKPFSATAALYNVAHGDDSKFTIETLKLTDTDGKTSYTNDNTFGYTEAYSVFAKKVEYDRTFGSTWCTIDLPFSLTSEQLSLLGVENVYTFHGMTFDWSKNQYTVSWDPYNGNTIAGTPYILKFKNTGNKLEPIDASESPLEIKGVTIPATGVGEGNTEDKFIGCYAYTLVPRNTSRKAPLRWLFTRGKFYPYAFVGQRGNEPTDCRPFRGYFEFPESKMAEAASSSAKGISSMDFSIWNGTTTGINPQTIIESEEVNGPIYNLSGQIVSKDGSRKLLPRGVYIQNNQKFVVK